MKKKHQYVKFDNVHHKFEENYNHITRQQEYSYEKDALGRALFFGNEDDLHKYRIADKRRKEYLGMALAELKENYPMEYTVFTSRYSPNDPMSISQIACMIGMSKTTVYRKIEKARKHLQALVNKYKKEC